MRLATHLVTLATAIVLWTFAGAHPLSAASPQEQAVIKEALAARDAIKVAVQAKDVERLKALYTEDYTHTHGSGKVDGRDSRIVSLLAAEPTIEMAPVHDVSAHAYGGQTVVLRARSPILNVKEKRDYDFRWIQVFVKTSAGWRLAASQATRLTQ